MDVQDELPLLIGRRVARRRAELSLSLEQIADRTGVSRAMVSRIERGEVHASAVVLDKLCGGLGMTLSTLFARDATSPLSRRADQLIWTDPQSGYVRREVTPAGIAAGFKVVDVEFPAGAEVRLEKSRNRSIEQCVWVLEGEMEIDLPGNTYGLSAGDCLAMSPDEGIVFRNRTDRPARYAVILTSEASP